MTPLIQARDIHKAYTISRTELRILHGASLEVHCGETVSVVGKSGAGKSTLLHVLGGLDRPDDGHVLVDGVDLYRLPSRRRTRIRAERIGFVFQSYHLLPEMDVLENVFLPSMAVRRPMTSTAPLRKAALELLDAVGLADRADHTPLELSGGEQQRVALARALMNDPDIILADEPTGNLDEATGGQTLSLLFSLVRDRGHALVLVTHNEHIAASCDRLLRLEDGKLELDTALVQK